MIHWLLIDSDGAQYYVATDYAYIEEAVALWKSWYYGLDNDSYTPSEFIVYAEYVLDDEVPKGAEVIRFSNNPEVASRQRSFR